MPTSIASLRPYRTAVADNRRWAGFEPRPGDIFVCTPPKCGTTWMQTIIASLLWPEGDPPAPVLELSPWLEFEADPIGGVPARLAAQRHRRVIKTHTPADGIPFFPASHYVFVARDGRDAFMSLCNHMERFRDDVREGLNARVAHVEHVGTFWEHRREPNVLLVHYNDLKSDLAREMRWVAEFLDIAVPPSRWPAVVERCTFESMQGRAAEIGPFDRFFEGGGKSFLFKGTNGRWRDVLTPDELASYASRVAAVLPPAGGAWLERGRHAADPRGS